MSKRMIIIILLFFAFVVSICVFLAAAYLPKYREQLSDKQSTSTQAAYINQTQAFVATGTASQSTREAKTQEAMISQTAYAETAESQTCVAATLTAQPTPTPSPTTTLSPTSTLTPSLTPTPTPTFTPSPTFTTTPIPEAVICPARVFRTDHKMYLVPGGGRSSSATLIEFGQKLNVIGRLEDPGWYKVNYQGTQGWMRSDFISFETNCQPTVYHTSYLLDITGQEDEIVLDDTFIANQNHWTYDNGQAAYPERSNYSDEQLVITSKSAQSVRLLPGNPNVANLSNFHLYVSFNRTVFDRNSSWVGLRFRSTDENHYLLTLTPLCQLKLYANQDIVFQRDIPPVQCLESSYFLDVEMKGYDLIAKINDSEPILVTLPDPNGLFTSGGIALEAANAKARYEFIVITTPK